ncbi:Protein BOI2 [[Candida] zeylanoides]
MDTNGSIYLCVKQFNARLGDELNLKIGDKVEVLADDSEYNDGWYMGRNLLTNDVGLYPKTFTQLLHTPKNPEQSLLRSRSRRVATPPGKPRSEVDRVTESLGGVALLPKPEAEGTAVEGAAAAGPDAASAATLSDIDRALAELQNSPAKKPSIIPGRSTSSGSSGGSGGAAGGVAGGADTPDPREVLSWSPQQVTAHFASAGFDPEVAGKFARHKITGGILFELDLAHLKEIDIDSFGTRFEVYKEIEKLKGAAHGGSADASASSTPQAVKSPYAHFNDSSSTNNTTFTSQHTKSASHLMPSAPLGRGGGSPDTAAYTQGHQRKRSQSLDDLAAAGPPTPRQLEVTTPSTEDKRRSMAFMSPRKAPGPPAAPSPLNKGFRFGSGTEEGSPYVTRSNASGLGINGLSRPASSIYDNSMHSRQASGQHADHRREPSGSSVGAPGHHRRHSSLFSFLSNHDDLTLNGEKTPKQSNRHSMFLGDTDGYKSKLDTPESGRSSPLRKPKTPKQEPIDIDHATLSPKKSKSLSYRQLENKSAGTLREDDKRSASDSNTISRLKTLRTTSTQNFKSLTSSKKSKTSAFQEGIRHITPDDAIKSATYSGWMSKKSGSNIGWRSRYFTLHGTRLSYFTSLKDKRERGLIDITAHKVIPVNTEDATNSNDKYIAMYASSTGFGRYCFKIVPPAPGFKKGLTFTQPKTHYFAVETQEDMRGWLKALMTATIDIDDTVPVVSSCSTPTVTLSKAQELLAKAREETKLKDEELREQGYLRDGARPGAYVHEEEYTSEENSPVIHEVERLASVRRDGGAGGAPQLSVDTSGRNVSSGSARTPTTPQLSNQGGFASPYLLASGLLSPRSGSVRDSGQSVRDSGQSVLREPASASSGNVTQSPASSGHKVADHFTGDTTPKSVFSNSNGRVVSGGKKKGEKMLAYSSDGTGNHSFVIKTKK